MEKIKRIFIELHTYDTNRNKEVRALLNIDEISGILEYSSIIRFCNASIVLNGTNTIEVIEDYDTIVSKINQLKQINGYID